MKLYIKVAIILCNATLVACATCNEKLISHSEQGLNSADVRFRYCGYASGYSVAVYATKKGALGTGDGSKEIFKTHYRRVRSPENNLQSNSPISVEWKSDSHLIIYHKSRMTWEEDHKPIVTKAQTIYQGINIEYIPSPVVVD